MAKFNRLDDNTMDKAKAKPTLAYASSALKNRTRGQAFCLIRAQLNIKPHLRKSCANHGNALIEAHPALFAIA